MTKSILVVALAVASTAIFTDAAQARGRRCYRNNAFYTNSGSVNNTNPGWASNTVPAVPATPANTGTAYQSYSYEPGQAPAAQPVPATTVAPAMVAPTPVYRPSVAARSSYGSEYNDVIRGDRKVRGHTAEGE